MAWKRHTRNLTKEVFYDGTTIDGSRLEKALGDIEEGVNNVQKGNTRQRFVATQYHAGFNPQMELGTDNTHIWPWLYATNDTAAIGGGLPVSSVSMPENAPYNLKRFKGITVPGIDDGIQSSRQFAWTRTLYFDKPVILYGVSVLLQNDLGATATRPFPGTRDAATAPAYTYTGGTGSVPGGLSVGSNTIDLPIVLDVMNPGSPEDAELTDVEYTRTLLEINEETTSALQPNASGVGWADFQPTYDSVDVADARPLYGRLFEHRDLNIPIHERARVRLAIVLPLYDNTNDGFTYGSWGHDPWYLQGWSVTITVLEEVQTL